MPLACRQFCTAYRSRCARPKKLEWYVAIIPSCNHAFTRIVDRWEEPVRVRIFILSVLFYVLSVITRKINPCVIIVENCRAQWGINSVGLYLFVYQQPQLLTII